jgi:hypothetical protein
MPASTNAITGIAVFIFGLLAFVPAAPGAKVITPPALCERATATMTTIDVPIIDIGQSH